MPQPPQPINANASPEARALLRKLHDLSGRGILTGQHNFPNHRARDTHRVFDITGRYPAVWGSDFGFLDGEDKDSILHRDLMIEEAKRQAAAGSIITLCWHMLRPTEDEPGRAAPNGGTSSSWRQSVQGRLSDAQWTELTTPGSPLYGRWARYIDTAASYLQQLQQARIPVLWRPLHENNGAFFWWGGRPGPTGAERLFRLLYDRMVHTHHLDNLLWVWNQNGPAPAGEFYSYFPGHDVVDILSYDNYRTLDERYYWELLSLAEGKPIALGETGTPPSVEILRTQPRWAWFMTWGGVPDDDPARLRDAYLNRYFIDRGDPLLKQ